MAALPSDNPLHAEINRTYNIKMFEYCEVDNTYKDIGICSANKVSKFINNEKLKIRLFNDVLDSGMGKSVKKIRSRLKIVFYLK